MDRSRLLAVGLLAALVMLGASVGAASAAGAGDGKYLLRLKLKSGDRLRYAYTWRFSHPDAEQTVSDPIGEHARTMDVTRQGEIVLLVVGEDAQGWIIVATSKWRLTRVLLDGKRDVMAKAAKVWRERGGKVAVEWQGVCGYWLRSNGECTMPSEALWYSSIADAARAIPIPLPDRPLGVGDRWPIQSPSEEMQIGTWGFRAGGAVAGLEGEGRKAVMRIRFGEPMEAPGTPADRAKAGTRAVAWLDVNRGHVLKFVCVDREPRNYMVKGSRTWETELQLLDRTTLGQPEIERAAQGRHLLVAAQEFTNMRNAEPQVIACLSRFCELYPDSPWVEPATWQISVWREMLRKRLQKEQDGKE